MKLEPLIVWENQKSDILAVLGDNIPESIRAYHEPFVGSGANLLRIQPKKAFINDNNQEVVDIFTTLKNFELTEHLALALDRHTLLYLVNRSAYYNKIRMADQYEYFSLFTLEQRAARTIFLNRLAKGNKYHINKEGVFDVEDISYIYPKLFDFQNIRFVGDFIRKSKAVVTCRDFSETIDNVKENDLVYLDPPKDIEFWKENSKKLIDYIKAIKSKKAYFVLETYNNPQFKQIFKENLETMPNVSVVKSDPKSASGFTVIKKLPAKPLSASVLVTNLPLNN